MSRTGRRKTPASHPRRINAIGGACAENLPVILVSGAPNSNDRATEHLVHHTLATHDFTYQLEIFERCWSRTVSASRRSFSTFRRANRSAGSRTGWQIRSSDGSSPTRTVRTACGVQDPNCPPGQGSKFGAAATQSENCRTGSAAVRPAVNAARLLWTERASRKPRAKFAFGSSASFQMPSLCFRFCPERDIRLRRITEGQGRDIAEPFSPALCLSS
jgi:hypothetical protein